MQNNNNNNGKKDSQKDFNIVREYLASSHWYHVEYNGIISEQDKRFLLSDVQAIFGKDVQVNFHQIKKSPNQRF